MPLANHPAVFACLGMVVGLYGILYFEVARAPERGWLIAAVGLTGKVLGPIGMLWLIWTGAWPVICDRLVPHQRFRLVDSVWRVLDRRVAGVPRECRDGRGEKQPAGDTDSGAAGSRKIDVAQAGFSRLTSLASTQAEGTCALLSDHAPAMRRTEVLRYRKSGNPH